MERAAKLNGRPIHTDDRDQIQSMCQLRALSTEEHPDQDSPSLFRMLRYGPGMRRNFLILCYMWFCYNLGYYGLVYNTPAFGWNVYLVFVFPAFFTLPVVVVSPLFENKLGRKFVMTVSLFVTAVATLATLAVPEGKKGFPA